MTDASSQSELPKLPLENLYLDDSKSLKALENGSEMLEINASGHIQEVDRNFSLLSITALGIVAGNTWTALGGAIVCTNYSSSSDIFTLYYANLLMVGTYRLLRFIMAELLEPFMNSKPTVPSLYI
jgi:hypothetical protein